MTAGRSNHTQFAAASAVEQHKPYVTVTHGMRGYFAVLLMWNDEIPGCGFYEPWNTSDFSYRTAAEAVPDAKAWAEAEDIEYRP